MTKAAFLTLGFDLRGLKVGYEARGVEWTTIGTAGGGRESRRRGKVDGSFDDLLIYAGCLLEGGVKGAGRDKSRSNSLDIQAPGIPRMLLLSPEAIVQVTRTSRHPMEGKGWWW